MRFSLSKRGDCHEQCCPGDQGIMTNQVGISSGRNIRRSHCSPVCKWRLFLRGISGFENRCHSVRNAVICRDLIPVRVLSGSYNSICHISGFKFLSRNLMRGLIGRRALSALSVVVKGTFGSPAVCTSVMSAIIRPLSLLVSSCIVVICP